MKIRILLKALLKSSLLSRTYIRELKSKKRLWLLPLAGIGIVFGLVSVAVMLVQNYRAILSIGLETGEPGIVFLFSGIVSSVLTFFLGTPLCISNIFYSKDNTLVAALPVSTADIIISRVSAVYLFILPLHLFLTLPAVIIFFPAAGSVETIISAVIYGLTGPLFPLTAALAAASLLSLAGGRSRYRTAFEFIGMMLGIAVIAGIQMSFSRSLISGNSLTGITDMISRFTGILKKIFFASSWTAAGFTRGGWASMAAGTAFSAASAAAAVLLLKRASLNLTNVSSRKKSGTAFIRKKEKGNKIPSPGRSVSAALLRREWLVVKSNSAFISETIAETVILPIILLVLYITIPDDITSLIGELRETVDFMPLVIIGILVLISSINSVSSTSLSREGGTFSISKSLPISGRIQVKAKMFFHVLLFLSSWYLNLLLIMLILKLPVIHLVYLVPAGPAVILLGFAASIHIDLSRPVLNWTHPQQAMKQNMNVPIGMGFGMLVTAGLLLPAAGLYFLGVGPVITGLILTCEAAVIDTILIPKIFNYADKRYIEILP